MVSAKKKIVILTGNKNFFGQTRKPWVSMNVDKMEKIFRDHGYEVERYSFHQIVNRQERIKDSIIFYTFSQKMNRRSYVIDLIHCLDDGSNMLIPSREMLQCHENKGYQELYKKKINFTSLKALYFSSVEELSDYEIHFPIVLKTVDTSNGKGVFLVHNHNQLMKYIQHLEKQGIFTKIDLVRRKYFRRKKFYKEYPDYNNRIDYFEYRDYILKEKNFILQEFVPGLKSDYRVLVLYDKYYVMKRFTREGDFRASGTKIQDYDVEFNLDLMNYAKDVYDQFDTPFLSMDIGVHQKKFSLFEFQALHFGLNVFIKTKGYYTLDNGDWRFIEAKSSIEKEMAEALIKYIQSRG